MIPHAAIAIVVPAFAAVRRRLDGEAPITSSYSDTDARQMCAWTARHHRHSALEVRYDPIDPHHLLFAAPDMPPLAGPRAAHDVTLALIAGIACFVLLLLAKVA